MRIGLDSYTYHRLLGELRPGEEDPGERLADGGAAVVAEARALGVDAVSLETCYLGPPSRLDVAALRQAAAGLELALSWGAHEGLALGSRPDALDDLLDWVDLAPALGCRLMRIVAGGPRLRARAEEWPATVAPLRRAAERARERGLELALENHGDLTATQIDALLDAVAHPALGVCFDTANAPRVGDDPLAACWLLAPRIRMVHLKDVEAIESNADPVAGPRSVPYGEGIIPVEAVLSTLAAAGFDGLVCVEIAQLGPGVDERALQADCLRWLRARSEVGVRGHGGHGRGSITAMAKVDKEDNVETKLRLGVIGAGSWAVASHLPNFAKRDEVEFVAVARKGPDLLEKIKDDFGFQVASEDYRDVIDAGIDICLVSSPTVYHHEHAKAALEAGAHVLVEKPVTIDSAEAWDLVETADRASLHLVCSFGWNFLPMLQNAKRLIEERGVGEVEHLVVHMSSATRELLSNTGAYPQAAPEAVPEQRTWTDPRVSGGGYGQAQLSHALGLSLWLTGLRGQEAFAYMSTILDSPVEHYDAVSMRFANGAIGTMAGGSAHLGYDGNKHELAVRVIGSEGHFACDLQRELVWLYRADGDDVRLAVQPGDALYNCDGPPNTLVDLALGKDVRNWAPGELGARTVEILDAAYRSAASGKPEPVRESSGP